jgi:hypothetical protein
MTNKYPDTMVKDEIYATPPELDQSGWILERRKTTLQTNKKKKNFASTIIILKIIFQSLEWSRHVDRADDSEEAKKKRKIYRVSQNSRIPNSERCREGPSGARKMLRKKIALPEEDISNLILFNT